MGQRASHLGREALYSIPNPLDIFHLTVRTPIFQIRAEVGGGRVARERKE